MLFGLWQNAQKTDVRGRQSKRQARQMPRLSGAKMSFRPAEAVFRTLKKFKNWLIEREGGSLPPSLFPSCSVVQLFSWFLTVSEQTSGAADAAPQWSEKIFSPR